FYLARNTLVTQLKDLPLPILIASLPKILLFQCQQLAAARGAGFIRTVLRAYGSFLRAVPRTLRKRRLIHRGRPVTAQQFGSNLLREYPLQTRFSRRNP